MDWNIVVKNLEIIGIAMLFYIALWMANFCLSLFYNLKIIGESFSREKMFEGMLKLLSVVVGTGLLVVCFTTLPIFMRHIGMTIPEDWDSLFNIVGIAGIIINGGMKYGKQAFEKISKIFKSEEVTEEQEETVVMEDIVVNDWEERELIECTDDQSTDFEDEEEEGVEDDI